MSDNTLNIGSLFTQLLPYLLGGSGVVYGVVTHWLNRKQKEADARVTEADADIKSDEFWKNRYDVLQQEMDKRDEFWKMRYDNLYQEYRDERTLSNDIVKSLRSELNNLRTDYEKQQQIDEQKYNDLLEEKRRQEKNYMCRIDSLEGTIAIYENRIKDE